MQLTAIATALNGLAKNNKATLSTIDGGNWQEMIFYIEQLLNGLQITYKITPITHSWLPESFTSGCTIEILY